MAFTGNYACDIFRLGLAAARFDFYPPSTQVFKIALYTNEATLDASTQAYTTVGEVTDAGYTAGGNVLTPTATYSGDVAYVSFSNTSWTGAITARGALIYRAISSSTGSIPANTAICVLDFGSNKTSTTTFTVEFPANTDTTAIIRIG
jgi:hypothetical protein